METKRFLKKADKLKKKLQDKALRDKQENEEEDNEHVKDEQEDL
jgi:hypothetical protein